MSKHDPWLICPACKGEGSHVNPNIDAGGISAEDFYDDPDFFDDYMSGMYDVPCDACHGPGKAHCDDPKKPRAIARLGGTCNACNVLPICRQCHDDTNSPEFDYRTALPQARHPAGDPKQGYR